MNDLSLDKMVQQFKESHKNIKNEKDALEIWETTYKGNFENSNTEAWHWTAFGMAFLNFV